MASNYALQTRSGAEDPIFGTYLEQLPSNKLPTLTEIYRNFLFRRESEFERLYKRNGKIVKSLAETSKNKIANEIIEDLKRIWWTGASIPVRENKGIFVQVKNLIVEGAKLSKSLATAKAIGNDEYLRRNGFDRILDISKCRY